MEVCPVCRTDAYLNPKIRFLISPCYHWLCDSCVTRLFSHGSAPCPHCGTTLRHASFSTPTMLDHRVEKECRIRRSLRGVMRRREEFGEAEEWERWVERWEGEVERLVGMADAEAAGRELEELRRYLLNGSGTERVSDLQDVTDLKDVKNVKRRRIDTSTSASTNTTDPITTIDTQNTNSNILPININRPLSIMEQMIFATTNRLLSASLVLVQYN